MENNKEVLHLRDSNFFIRVKNYMPKVYDSEYLYLHQIKGIGFEFRPSKRGATIFETKLAMQMLKDLLKIKHIDYKKYELKAIDMYED